MSNKEEFENWLKDEYCWGEATLECSHFRGDDKKGYYLGGDHQFGGKSCSDPLFWAWRGWQARNNLDSTEELTEKVDPKQTFQEIVPPYLKGDVILLNSGEGPKMVVSNFNVSNGLIYVTWFVNGVIKSDYIHYAMVTKEKKSVK